MGRSKGFTLIELIVSMAIMAIIMGALVQLFGTSVSHEITGFNQQEMYAQARRLENDLKNTLRYTIDNRNGSQSIKFSDGIKGEIIDTDRSMATKLTYTSIVYNNAQNSNQKIAVTLEWVDNSKKQIRMHKEIHNAKADGSGYEDNFTTEAYVFPENKDNSAFDTVKQPGGGGIAFPVTAIIDTADIHAGMLKITLPFKYKFANSGYKTNVLETKVAFEDVVEDDGEYYKLPACINAKSNIWDGNSSAIANYNSVTGIYNNDYWGMAPNIQKDMEAAGKICLDISSNIYPTATDESRVLNGDYNRYDLNFAVSDSISLQSQWGGVINIKNGNIKGKEGAVLNVLFSGSFENVDFEGPLTIYLSNQNNNLNFVNCQLKGDIIFVLRGVVKFSKLKSKDSSGLTAIMGSGQITFEQSKLDQGGCFISADHMIISGSDFKGQLQANNFNITNAQGGKCKLVYDDTALKNLQVKFDNEGKFSAVGFKTVN